ncbi:MAG: hypothetical protein L0219_10690 [Phycisphaerales bacterium]|nr:hypothetical protein [Phycisphaerales bacterium]MCI0674143.1 hypothetical protein [Phycisphaerales bacterium]
MKSLIFAMLAIWFVLVLLLGAGGAFVRPPGTQPLPILAGTTLPLVAFAAAWVTLARFREFVLSLDVRVLTAVQAWRVGGFMFVVLSSYGILPALFAWPAGWGDVAIGVTAPLALSGLLWRPEFARSPTFALWNALGILDLVIAVSLGGLSSGIVPSWTGDVTTAAMAQMPLVVIPAFFVPLFIMLHASALLQVRHGVRQTLVQTPGQRASAARLAT